jgi:hypothetical protein
MIATKAVGCVPAGAGGKGRTWVSALLLITVAASCGPAESLSEQRSLEHQSQELDSMNGLSANGLSANGLSYNGLSYNGLSANGLSTTAFSSWFQQAPDQADMVMRYLVRCAIPAGETRSYTDAKSGLTYTWSGGLGLTPGWASGAPATRAEQQTLTACLLAHVNRYGTNIVISILGRDAQGTLIPRGHTELSTWPVRESCVFGNLFTREGLFFGVDRTIQDQNAYLTRACAGLGSSGETSPQCAPLTFVGACWQICRPETTGPFYKDCTYNGVTYQPLTTRMRESDYEALFGETLATSSHGPSSALRGTDPTVRTKP